jgi:hypothetical protein
MLPFWRAFWKVRESRVWSCHINWEFSWHSVGRTQGAKPSLMWRQSHAMKSCWQLRNTGGNSKNVVGQVRGNRNHLWQGTCEPQHGDLSHQLPTSLFASQPFQVLSYLWGVRDYRKIRVGALSRKAERSWEEQNVRDLETAASLGVETNRNGEWEILKPLAQALKLLKACEQHVN